jgi:hypothetical protein
MSKNRGPVARSGNHAHSSRPPVGAATLGPSRVYPAASPGSIPRLELASRRQSKGGLRDLFSKPRPTRSPPQLSSTEEIGPSSRSSSRANAGGSIDEAWIPPPLFQAYPQSVKHIDLESSTLSAPTIIRLNEQRQAPFSQTDADRHASSIPSENSSSAKRLRRVSAAVAKADWTRKVYVLTTSGHLLQYAGDGAFDRKPEKILSLGQDSAAFVSDAIKGRHFVLQVSQSCSDDGEQEPESSRGIFSKIGIKTPGGRRSARVLLMVFDAANELESWLSAIRRMIESLGGRPYSIERSGSDSTARCEPRLSQRFQVRKDPHQFSKDIFSAHPLEAVHEERVSTPSSAYTATELERLRDSNVSNTAHTMTSSLYSPPTSPTKERTSRVDIPQLELLDLGPSSLFDLSKHARRPSQFAMMLSGILSNETLKAPPTEDSLRNDSSNVAPPAEPESSASPRDVPIRDISQRGTAAELPPSLVYTNVRPPSPFDTTEHHHPKRFSSLQYLHNTAQSSPSKPTLFPPSSSPGGVRRPISMQLRSEPITRGDTTADRPPSSLRSGEDDKLRVERMRKVASSSRQSLQQSLTRPRSTFGPPAGPPPSRPLPAVPTESRASR